MSTVVTLETLLPRLRQLTLSGMHAAIATRTQEARARSLDPLEFLQLLLDDELAQATPRRRKEDWGITRESAP